MRSTRRGSLLGLLASLTGGALLRGQVQPGASADPSPPPPPPGELPTLAPGTYQFGFPTEGSLRLDIKAVTGISRNPSFPSYPTDGQGAYGFTSVTAESFLRYSERCIIDGVICTFNSAGGGLLVMDAAGKPVGDEIVFVTPMPQPYFMPLHLPIETPGGFMVKVTGYAALGPPKQIGNGVAFTVLFRDLTGQ